LKQRERPAHFFSRATKKKKKLNKQATITIYCGAHRGLTARRRQEIGLRESMLLPVGAAVTLVGVYLLITYFKDLDLSAVVNAYFFVLSSAALFGAAAPPLRRVFGGGGGESEENNRNLGVEVSLPKGLFLDEQGDSVTKATLRASDAAALVFALSVAAADALTHHQNFTLSNACAAAVAADVLQLLGLRSFKAAGLLLGGLACYDVLAVFASGALTADGESLMSKVALAASGPTRLLFPRSAADLASSASASPFPFSLLGLGDVAIPGLLACLALKYDASRSVDMNARARAAAKAIDGALAELSASNPRAGDREYGDAAADAAAAAFEVVAAAEARARESSVSGSSSSSGEKGLQQHNHPDHEHHEAVVTEAALSSRVYFQAVMGAYALGLLIAFAVNAATGSGQPALLYLCPATLGAVALTAARRQEVERILSYKVAAGKPLFPAKEKV
jgi:minor histocompatibility antigen H13